MPVLWGGEESVTMSNMKYNKDTCAVETSVRALCELAAKSGDLGAFARSVDGFAALRNGAEVHRRLQSEAGGYYSPEVSLSATVLFDGLYYTVSGRADGIIRKEGGGLCVDEIKCVRSYEFYLPPRQSFLAQLKCYAYFVALRDELDRIDGRITYYNTDTEKIRYFNYSFTVEELRADYLDLLSRVSFFAKLLVSRSLDVLPSASAAVFPYSSLREGQEIMIKEIWGAMRRGQRLFVEAPTGTGKTMSALFPAIRAMGEGHIDRIFYLTAKASVRREAYAATSKLFRAGVGLRSVVLNSKESMCKCLLKQSVGYAQNMCSPDICPYARGYYDRVGEALVELLSGGNGYSASVIFSVAEKYSICPYELSLDLSEYCDVVICDYNYAFDPSVYLRRYFGEDGKREKYAFLIDEAHNLADRARDMYSAELRISQLRSVRALLGEHGELDAAFAEMERDFLELCALCRDNVVKDEMGNDRGFYMSRSPLERFGGALEVFKQKIDAFLRKNKEFEAFDALQALSTAIRKYTVVEQYFGKGFLCYVELLGGDILVKIYCLDPSSVMDHLLDRAKSAVMFSATLTPAEYFCDVLGSSQGGVSVSLPSPFDEENLCVAVADFASTRFDDRDANVGRYVSAIAATVSAKAGNYIVYFPSYSCLEKVSRAFAQKYPRVEQVVQSRNMTFAQKEEFLKSFKDDAGKTRVGFCVLGGAFSEGVDLPGSRLIGAIIIGVGLPGLSNERNIIRDYFDEDTGVGYDYAYTYPGMNNVLQAAGRVIRTDEDRGVVVLVDDRYATPKYRELFPGHWKQVQYAGNAKSLAEIARRFWEKHP